MEGEREMKHTLHKRGLWLLTLLATLVFALGMTAQAAGVQISQKSLKLAIGQDAVLSVIGTTKQATFTSSNTKVASVGKKSGRVTVKKAGTATITARVGKKSYKCKVTVTEGDYKKLYREFLAANRRSIGKFYVLNVDKKGCPELITIPTGLGGAIIHYDVYTVKSNKVVLAGSYAAKGMGSYVYYSAKSKGLYASGWTNYIGGAWGNLFGISKYKLVQTHHMRAASNPKYVYYTGKTDTLAKKVSKSAYNKYFNKYYKGYKKYRMLDNTTANREKL